MKALFLTLLVTLLAASVLKLWSMPDVASPVPIIYRVTDANPARDDQIHLFHLWQVEHGHSVSRSIKSEASLKKFFSQQSRLMRRSLREINPHLQSILDGSTTATIEYPVTIVLPKAEMRIDTANSDITKRIIQGVSGVGGDLLDLNSGQTMWQFQGMGLLTDVTESARRLGFGPEHTYPALLPEITMPAADGSLRQYMFPCNAASLGYVVNLETLRKYGLEAPPTRWTVTDFERIGSEFVKRANHGLARNRFFFAGSVEQNLLRRSFGVDALNETMTACALDDPRAVDAARTFLRWQNDLRLVPSAADRAGFSSDSGYLGQEPQLFNNGNYAMSMTGRYTLIQYRQFNIDRVSRGQPPMQLVAVEPPHAVLPVSTMTTRALSIYAGGKHPELAELFLAFLASEAYNMQIVRDADSLPPNPRYTDRAEYLQPAPDPARGIYPETENGLHRPFKQFAETIGIAASHSPFILTVVVQREVSRAEDAYTNASVDPAAALFSAKRRIDAEITRNLAENPVLQPLFQKKLEQQKRIDELKTAITHHLRANPTSPIPPDMQIPVSLLDNPFHRVFLVKQGWAFDDSATKVVTQ